jgi:hypothetical protein
MILPLTQKHYREAKRRGWIKDGIELVPLIKQEHGIKEEAEKSVEGKEYWMVGSIAPCEIEVIK